MAIVVLVCTVDESLELRNIVWVREIDHIDAYIILPQTLAKSLILRLLLFERMATKDDYARLCILVDSVLKGQ